METSELLKKVRRIEIKTRGLSTQLFSGEYHSAFKGKGMTFSEVREYQYGDPIRTIDWNVTARFNHPFVKVFEEEREMNVMLLLDLSASENFGTKQQTKKDLILEIAAVLAFSASTNNDKIGAILFTDTVEKFIPPKKGKSHILRIIREVLEFKPKNTKTNITEPCVFLTKSLKKKSTVFILSDFMDNNYLDALRIANKKHDMVALWITDPLEEKIPENVGLIRVKDNETGKIIILNTSDKKSIQHIQTSLTVWKNTTKEIFIKSGIDFANIHTNVSYVTPLMNLFKMREYRR